MPRIGRRRYPLRRIVGYAPHPDYPAILQEVLECGHQQSPLVDAFGETVAVRRRCRQCASCPQNVDEPGIESRFY